MNTALYERLIRSVFPDAIIGWEIGAPVTGNKDFKQMRVRITLGDMRVDGEATHMDRAYSYATGYVDDTFFVLRAREALHDLVGALEALELDRYTKEKFRG